MNSFHNKKNVINALGDHAGTNQVLVPLDLLLTKFLPKSSHNDSRIVKPNEVKMTAKVERQRAQLLLRQQLFKFGDVEIHQGIHLIQNFNVQTRGQEISHVLKKFFINFLNNIFSKQLK